MSLKRFVLNVFTDGELDEVIVGLYDINQYTVDMMVKNLPEDTSDEIVDLYEFEGELEEEDNE